MPKKLHTEIKNDDPLRELIAWEAPERAWKPKERAWFAWYSLFFVLIIAVAALLQQFFLILALIAFSFLWFTQGAIEPSIVRHSITPIGMKTFGQLFKWKEIRNFWFSSKKDYVFLNLDVEHPTDPDPDRFRRFVLLIDTKDLETLFKILIEYIDYGSPSAVGTNPFTSMIHGRYIPLTKFVFSEEQERS